MTVGTEKSLWYAPWFCVIFSETIVRAQEEMIKIKIKVIAKTLIFSFFTIIASVANSNTHQESDFPGSIRVKPVFFVPKNEQAPTQQQKIKLIRHLKLAQKWYKRMLLNRDTYELVEGKPQIIDGKYTLDEYIEKYDNIALQVTSEILTTLNLTRFNCPYIFLIIFMQPDRGVPNPSGVPFNGGINNGPGLVIIPSHRLDTYSNIQGTIQHELGHSFGLVHTAVYGYDMKTNSSIMSRGNTNIMHNGFRLNPKATLIPEDLRTLSYNKKVFPKFHYDLKKDVPEGYKISNVFRSFGPREILGQKSFKIIVSTKDHELEGTSVSNIVHTAIRTDQYYNPKSRVGFDPKTMWLCQPENGKITATLTFPIPVSLSKLCIHSGCGGKYHSAKSVQVQVENKDRFVDLCTVELKYLDEYISFNKTKAQVWRFSFKTQMNRKIIIRGVRFFTDRCEIFSPVVPYQGGKN